MLNYISKVGASMKIKCDNLQQKQRSTDDYNVSLLDKTEMSSTPYSLERFHSEVAGFTHPPSKPGDSWMQTVVNVGTPAQSTQQ